MDDVLLVGVADLSWEIEYSFYELQAETFDLALAEPCLIDGHLTQQFIEVDIAVFKDQINAFCLDTDDHVFE